MVGRATSFIFGCAATNLARARRANWRQVPTGRPTVCEIESKGTPNTSCSTKLTRSPGLSLRRTSNSALRISSSRVTRSAGSERRAGRSSTSPGRS